MKNKIPTYNDYVKTNYEIWTEHFTPLVVIDDLKNSHHGVTSHDLNHDGKTMDLIHVNPWHHEGVWEHVHMVRDEALKISDDPLVEMLALLHDVAKPFMRFYNKDNNRVRFSGHEFGSALFSVNFLKKHFPHRALMMLKVITLHIMGLRGDNIYEFETDEEVLHYLRLLNTADNAGRISEDIRDPQEAFDKWIPVENTVREETEKTYTVLIGIPGSGKSTFLKDYNGEVFNHDDTMVRLAEEKFGIVDNYNEAFNAMKDANINWVPRTVEASLQALKTTDNVCLDATNLIKKKRLSIAKRARRNGSHVKFVMFWRDWFDCWDCRSTGDKTIPLGVYKSMIDSFSYPSTKEYDSIEHIII